VEDIPAKAWITSHHKGVITDRAQFLQLLAAFAARLDAREEAIAGFLRAKPATLEQLIAHRFVYPQGLNDLFFEDVERRTISQHLDALARSGRARRDGDLWQVV
jgi:hypothetical protein